MRRTPLFAVHTLAGARFTETPGTLIPAGFLRDPAAECAAAREGAGVFDRADQHVVTLVGPDARRFANGMFTNNIRALPVGGSNRNAMVDEKARIQGLLTLACLADDTFLAILDGVTAEAFEARYGRYIVFDDVELTDLSAERTVLSVQGPRAAEVLTRAGLPAPESGCAQADGVTVVVSPRARAGGFDLVVPTAGAAATWQALLAAGAAPAGWDASEILRIEAGSPRWPIDMGERALLHEMGLVARCAAFDKGCYIGQEVLNRVDVMGQVNRQIRGLTLHEDALPPHGAEVRAGDAVVGTVLSGAREGTRVRTLALLRKDAWESGTQVTVHAGERAVGATVSALPFPD
jgi:folate-binding protein YgfZ